MLKLLKLFVVSTVVVISCGDGVSGVQGWKPIAGPPAAFTIRQSHPAVGSTSILQHTQHIPNTITSDVSSGSSDHSYAFLDDHQKTALLANNDDDISSEYKTFKIDGKAFSSTSFDEDACSVDKYAFNHVGTVTYNKKIPKLDQFTICFWMRFTNHTGDHTLFTYSVADEPREIQIWIANSKGSSYVSMALHGQSLYRLNYPMKMRMWHHACSSWNGKTGEWQLWIRDERVGRGFHNRLVNHKIPGGGVAFSGGPSVTGPVADGLHFELTLLQIYKVALTAGKAHRDHKHHHVHQFNHDGPLTTTTPAPTPLPQAVQVMNPFLANGQIPTRVRINLARPPNPDQQESVGIQPVSQGATGIPSQIIGGTIPGVGPQQQITINTNFANGQFNTASRLLSQQLVSAGAPQNSQEVQPGIGITFPGTPLPLTLGNPSSQQFIDEADPDTESTRFFFKRDNSPRSPSNKKLITKRQTEFESGKQIRRRGLIALDDGSVIDDALLAHGYQFEGLAQFGLPDFKKGLQDQMSIEDEIKEHDKEPAEEEVKAVMNLCTACDVEPFKGAIAFAWKNAIVSQENTLKGRSVGGCGYF